MGNDTYVVDASGDVVTESGSDTADLVQSSVTALTANVENLILTGSLAINGIGSVNDNILIKCHVSISLMEASATIC